MHSMQVTLSGTRKMIAEEIGQEAFNMICGQKLGGGMSRQVYACKLKPGYVVKVEISPYPNFQNVQEWLIWQAVRDTPYSRWFACCDSLSDDGKILIQERTRPAAHEDYPEKIPAFFTDLKKQNWGMTTTPERNWFVCHDYGVHMIYELGLIKRLKKANFFDENGS